jgi:hypothetical protein
VNTELKAIYISVLSDNRRELYGPILECMVEYSVNLFSIMPGCQFARIILRHLVNDLKRNLK